MQDQGSGYDKNRFTKLTGDTFDCVICSQVAVKPKECSNCGSMFCEACIDKWLNKSHYCPNKCTASGMIKPVSRALMRIYNDLELKCQHYDRCKTILPISDLEAHESICTIQKCENYEICGNPIDPKFEPYKVCDTNCLLLLQIKQANGDWTKMYKDVHSFMRGADAIEGQLGPGVTNFKWDNFAKGSGIQISENDTRVFLQEDLYVFKTVFGDQSFHKGIHYWEIHLDPVTEHELKIGVALKKDINFNTAFCDTDIGFGYYGIGQLRNGSSMSGAFYGKKFKNNGVLGVFLNMDKGTLSFALNDENFGFGFQSQLLKKGPIWPAVALLNCAGCKLVTGKKPPQYFLP